MRDVAIVGAGITPCKGHWLEKTYYGLGQWAVKEAVADADVQHPGGGRLRHRRQPGR